MPSMQVSEFEPDVVLVGLLLLSFEPRMASRRAQSHTSHQNKHENCGHAATRE